MSTDQHISSLLVHCRPDRLPDVAAAIGSLGEAEIHASDSRGKLIVTLETGSESVLRDRIDSIGNISGVLSTSLVYHQVE